jgi:hypothetical protein
LSKPYKVFAEVLGVAGYMESRPFSYGELIQHLSAALSNQMQDVRLEEGPKTVGIHFNGDYISTRECVKIFRVAEKALLQEPTLGRIYMGCVESHFSPLRDIASFYCDFLSEYAFHAADHILTDAKTIRSDLCLNYDDFYGWCFAGFATVFLEALSETGYEGNAPLRVWDTFGGEVCPLIKTGYASRWRDLIDSYREGTSPVSTEIKEALLYKFFVSTAMERTFDGFVFADFPQLMISPHDFEMECEELGISLPCEREIFVAVCLAIFVHDALREKQVALACIPELFARFRSLFHAFGLDVAFRLLQKRIPPELPFADDPSWKPRFLGADYRFRL